MRDEFISKEITETKICQICGTEKPLKSFTHKRKNKSPLYSNNCFACKSKIARYNKGVVARNSPYFCNASKTLVKTCVSCKTIKSISEFSDSQQGKCKTCRADYLKQWYKENFERIQIRNKHRLENLSDSEKKILKQKRSLWSKTWREKLSPSEQKSFAHRHRDIKRKSSMTYRARQLNCPVIIPFSLLDIIKRDGLICYLCNKVLTICQATIEHILPLTRGGNHKPENAKIACLSCNSSKSNKTLTEYKKYRGDYAVKTC